MFKICDLAIEPEMYPGKRRMRKTRQQALKLCSGLPLRQRREEPCHSFKGQRKHYRVEISGLLRYPNLPPPG